MPDLSGRVKEWLEKQGFPLEFAAARIFSNAGFSTDQGAYLSDPREGTLREIDVIASSEHIDDGRRYRFSVAAECKWSQDKPWVIFTSRSARPSPAASLAYLLGSPFAEALLWFLAGDSQAREANSSVMLPRTGFGGRQALNEKKEKDLFYAAIQSVVAAAIALADDTRDPPDSVMTVVRNFHVVIPTIVLDGQLFESYLEGSDLKIEATNRITVAWRGFGGRSQPTFVNVVTLDALSQYAEDMLNYSEFIRFGAEPFAAGVAKAATSKDPRDLPTQARPSDVTVPWLLRGMV